MLLRAISKQQRDQGKALNTQKIGKKHKPEFCIETEIKI